MIITMVDIIFNILIGIFSILLIWAIICTIDIERNYDRETYPRWNWIEWLNEKLEERGYYEEEEDELWHD